MTSSAFQAFEPLYPPAAMLGAALRIARADTDPAQEPFGELLVTLYLKQGAALKGHLLSVEHSEGEVLVILRSENYDGEELREDYTLVPGPAISAARLHLTEVQSRRLRTGEGTEKPDPYHDARRRCRDMAEEITESEYDFSAADVTLSIDLASGGLPRDGLAAIRIDALLDHLERALIYAARRPVTRQVLIHACPAIRIEPGAELQCRVEDRTLIVPVRVEDDDVAVLSEEALESQLNAIFRARLAVIPRDEVASSWRRLEEEAEERNEGRVGRPVVIEVDTADLPPIDDDKSIELRDVVTKVFEALDESEERGQAYGELFDKFVFRRSDERSCRLEGRAFILPVVMDEDWSIESIWGSEVGEEIDRLIS